VKVRGFRNTCLGVAQDEGRPTDESKACVAAAQVAMDKQAVQLNELEAEDLTKDLVYVYGWLPGCGRGDG